MKTFFSIFLCSLLTITVSAQHNPFNSGIFLHHSTGLHIWGPNDTTVSVPDEIVKYNAAHNLKDSNAFSLNEQAWPPAPDNEWTRWHNIFNSADTSSDIRPILADNKIVIIKSCFPSSQMTGTGSAAATVDIAPVWVREMFDAILAACSPAVVSASRGPVPAEFALSQNYPNPFNPSTTIRFGLAERSRVSLVVYDVAGRTTAVLADADMPAGNFTVGFDGDRLSSGVYFYRIHAVHGSSVYTETKRLILMK
jgi:hypothetical protein